VSRERYLPWQSVATDAEDTRALTQQDKWEKEDEEEESWRSVSY